MDTCVNATARDQSTREPDGPELLARPILGVKPDAEQSLLTVSDLSVDFVSVDGRVKVIDRVSLNVRKAEVVGVVGESGSGKTTLALTILGLLDSPPAQITNGKIVFQGRDLLKIGPEEMATIRGTGIAMVFQEPLDSLNPVYKVQSQIEESIEAREKIPTPMRGEKSGDHPEKQIINLLSDLCIDKPEEVLKQYPHELSGGMRQRVSIAMSIIETPDLLILDEPTTGLDAYVQNRILGMLSDLKESGATMLYITHDLTVASQICDSLYIMYAGRLMEVGGTQEVLEDPLHPYTNTLIASVPRGFEGSPPLPVQIGDPPDLRRLPTGCRFRPRCPCVRDVCEEEEPSLLEVAPQRYAACWKFDRTNGKCC